MLEHVPSHLLHQYNLYDRKGKLGVTTNKCNFPHKAVAIDVSGNCMVCECDGWLPISVCNIMEVDKLEQIWQSPRAKIIQDTVDQGKFTWCSVNSCGILKRDKIRETHYVSINIDESCNLACPSCRKSKIYRTNGDEFDSRYKLVVRLLDLINKFDSPIEIMMSGNGDPFASLIYRPLLLGMEPKENVNIRFLTNGLLLKKLMPKMRIKESIRHLDISIDAGDCETYEKVRLGGKWETLIENLDYVKHNMDCEVTLKFVLQKDNLDSLENFVSLVERYQFRGNIIPLEDWSAMKNFSEHNVMDPAHPLNAKAKQLLDKFRNNKSLFFHSI
jgi:sulfatase maturation enzyme AslB (radical SAM superfamily)